MAQAVDTAVHFAAALIAAAGLRTGTLTLTKPFVSVSVPVLARASQDAGAPLAAADTALQAGRYAEAAQYYEHWLASHPARPEVLFALGTCYIELGRTADAATVLRRHNELKPRSASGHALLGIALLDAADTRSAKVELETAIQLNPSQRNAVEALARLHLVENRPARALALLRGMRSPDVHLLAEALLRSGQPRSAATLLEERLDDGGSATVETYVLAGWARIKAGDPQHAAEICERGMRSFPDSEIESVYLTLPAPVLAERTAIRLSRLQANPDVSEMIALGRVLVDVDPGRKTRALELAQKLLADAVERAPENPSAHYNYGRLLRQRSIDDALAAWAKALALKPADALALQIHTQIAKAKESVSDFEGAEQSYRAALALNRTLAKRAPEPALEYVRFLQLTSRDAEANAILNEILGWSPWSPDARLERARMLASKGQWEQVIADAEFVLQTAGDNDNLLRTAHLLLAKTYYRLNQPEKARVHGDWLKSRNQ